MALSFGFFNSVNGDRKYNSRQISHLFDGMITDGVMAHVGTHFAVNAGPGMAVTVGTGRAWFNHTWAENDSNYIVVVSTPTPAVTRTDYLVLEIDERDTVRNGAIRVLRGSDTGAPPTLTNTDEVHQHLMATITVPPTATYIQAANITVKVGTSDCPFATSILESVSIDNLYAQWNDEFNSWFVNLKDNIDEESVASILTRLDAVEGQTRTLSSSITALNSSVSALNTKIDTTKDELNTTIGQSTNHAYWQGVPRVGDIIISATDPNNVTDMWPRGTYLRCDGSVTTNAVAVSKFPDRKPLYICSSIENFYGGLNDPIKGTYLDDSNIVIIGSDEKMAILDANWNHQSYTLGVSHLRGILGFLNGTLYVTYGDINSYKIAKIPFMGMTPVLSQVVYDVVANSAIEIRPIGVISNGVYFYLVFSGSIQIMKFNANGSYENVISVNGQIMSAINYGHRDSIVTDNWIVISIKRSGSYLLYMYNIASGFYTTKPLSGPVDHIVYKDNVFHVYASMNAYIYHYAYTDADTGLLAENSVLLNGYTDSKQISMNRDYIYINTYNMFNPRYNIPIRYRIELFKDFFNGAITSKPVPTEYMYRLGDSSSSMSRPKMYNFYGENISVVGDSNTYSTMYLSDEWCNEVHEEYVSDLYPVNNSMGCPIISPFYATLNQNITSNRNAVFITGTSNSSTGKFTYHLYTVDSGKVYLPNIPNGWLRIA